MPETYAFSGFVLDCEAGTLAYGETQVKLTAKSLAVLELLVRRAPATVSRADFEAAVWPEGFIEPANLTQTIYMIRKAAAPFSGVPLIETLNARGYRLATRVERLVPTSTMAILPNTSTRPTAAGAARGVLSRVATSLALAAGLAYAATLVAGGDRIPKPSGAEARQNDRPPVHAVRRSG